MTRSPRTHSRLPAVANLFIDDLPDHAASPPGSLQRSVAERLKHSRAGMARHPAEPFVDDEPDPQDFPTHPADAELLAPSL